MESHPAFRMFCKLAILDEDPDGGYKYLTYKHGGWAGTPRDFQVSDTVIRTVSNFVQARPAVLHIDDLINKKKNNEVRFLASRLLEQRVPIQVAFLQGTVPFESDVLFLSLIHI